MKWLNHKWFAPSGLSALYNGGETPKVLLKKTVNIQTLLQYPYLQCGWTCALIITTKQMGWAWLCACDWVSLLFVACYGESSDITRVMQQCTWPLALAFSICPQTTAKRWSSVSEQHKSSFTAIPKWFCKWFLSRLSIQKKAALHSLLLPFKNTWFPEILVN